MTPKPESKPTCEELLALIKEGLSMAREVPAAGSSFAASVSDTLRSIAGTVQDTERVTPKQARAVRNMIGGLQKWLKRTTH